MEEILISIRWIVAGLFLLIFLACAVMNLILLIRKVFLKQINVPSYMPFVGGFAGALGLTLIPSSTMSRWAWVALIADYGTFPWLSVVLAKAGLQRIQS